MLEAARVIVSRPQLSLAAPLLFLFNGGEETFSQAAHGFMAANTRPLGAFINLESTGPGGPDYLFQHAGKWIQHTIYRALYTRHQLFILNSYGLLPAYPNIVPQRLDNFKLGTCTGVKGFE